MNLPITQEEANLIAYALKRMAIRRAQQAEDARTTGYGWDREIAASNEKEAKTYYRLSELFKLSP